MNEFSIIDRFAANLPRPAAQHNALHESDCELLDLPSGDVTLAITTDDLVEELALGFYPDPYTIGWVALTASLSDLAAVSADPLAALVSLGIHPGLEADFLDGVASGIADVCRANGIGIAGGDTNATPEFRIGCTAVGTLPRGAALTRRGCRPGDRVYVTGPLGTGALAALGRSAGGSLPTPAFRPVARLREGRSLRGVASACIDTSDGALDALGRLARLNGVGFDVDVAGCFDPSALAPLEARGLPGWLLLASLHGEFELLFTVPPGLVGALGRVSGAAGWRPIALGTVTGRPGIRIDPGTDVPPFVLDPLAVRALFEGYDGDLESLIAGLLALVRS